MANEHRVELGYDPHGAVWMVTRSSVPGLHLQDKTLEGLVGKVNLLAPQLIVDNLGREAQAAPLHIDIPNSLEAATAAR
jgi:hypothetical protein